MKNFMYAMILTLAIVAVGCGKSGEGDAADAGTLKDNKDSVSYAIGYDIGKNFATQGVEVNLAVFSKAIEEGLAGTTPKLDEQQSRAVMMAYQQVLQKKQQEKHAAEAGTNMEKSTKFLAENKTKPGVVELPSGLQYQVIKEGTGKMPTIEDQVTTNYHGTLMDGSVFDSSRERGEPATFPLKGVIQAWQQILPLMKEGASYKIWSPPALAYGEYGSPPKIGPNVALVFEIDLIKVLGVGEVPAGQPGQ